jgi:hypothetical protein
MEWLWFVTVVIGPILLLAVILYATFRYWNRRKELDAFSDRRSKEVREEQAREERRLG